MEEDSNPTLSSQEELLNFYSHCTLTRFDKILSFFPLFSRPAEFPSLLLLRRSCRYEAVRAMKEKREERGEKKEGPRTNFLGR